MHKNNQQFPKTFFTDGTLVTFRILNILLNNTNRDKTVRTILATCHNSLDLNQLIHYILNPAFLLNTLYGLFLVHQNKLMYDNKCENIFNRYFCVTQNKNNYKTVRAIRNAIAHFHIEFDSNNYFNYLTFKDKSTKSNDFHFKATISCVDMCHLIEELESYLHQPPEDSVSC